MAHSSHEDLAVTSSKQSAVLGPAPTSPNIERTLATDASSTKTALRVGGISSPPLPSPPGSERSSTASRHRPQTPNGPTFVADSYFTSHSHYRSLHLRDCLPPTSNPSSAETSSTSLGALGEEADTLGTYHGRSLARAKSAQGSRSRSRQRRDGMHTKSPSMSTVEPSRSSDGLPTFPDQPFAPLHTQRPVPILRTRSSNPSQSSLYTSFSASPLSVRDQTSSTQGAKTAGNTPISSPGLFSPRTPQPAALTAMTEQSAGQSSPHLHPTHLLTPKETHIAEVDHDLYTGNKVINSYEVLSEIGRGEHGKVKLGQDLLTSTRVAVKIVPRFSNKRRLGKLGAPEDRVKKEVAILKKARHPNVVSLLEVIDDPNKKKVYIVLEYVEHGEIRWRKKGLREISLIHNRRLEYERQGRPETTETLAQDMLILRQARTPRQRVSGRARSVGQKPVPPWSLEDGGNDEDGEAASSSSQSALPTTMHIEGEAATTSAEVPSLLSNLGGPSPLLHQGLGRTQSVANTSTISHQSSELWEDDDDERSFVPTLTLAEAQLAFRDTLLGLEFLHFQGIIHRDIKPANLLMASDGHVKISDFGVSYLGKSLRDDEYDKLNDKLSEQEAKEMDDPRLLAKTVGTPAFYAPELIYWDTDIFEGGVAPTITGAIDLWALGVTLYCTIYGRLPFLGDGEWSLFEKVMGEEVFVPKQRLKPVDLGQDSRSSSQVHMGQLVSSDKRADHELAYEDVPETVRDLIKLLLIKDPAHRISIENAKMHPWVVEGMEDPGRWVCDTDPQRHGERKIVVSGEDVVHAVVKKTVLERTLEGIKGLAGNIMEKARKRATSAATSASASVESMPSNSGSSGATVGRDRHSKLSRRASVRGDDITSALKASREGEHHPLAQSQLAGSTDTKDRSHSDPNNPGQGGKARSTGSSPLPDGDRTFRPHGPERAFSALSTTESTKTVRAPQPKAGRSNLLDMRHEEMQSLNLFETTATSIGHIFSGAGKRLSGMRSRERRPLDGSRSSSADGRSPDGAGYAGPSLAVSNATASGKVTAPETLRADADPTEEVVAADARPPSPNPRRTSLFQPPSSSAEAFEHAQEINRRRQKLDADIDAERAASRFEARQSSLGCPPSPDDEACHAPILAAMRATPPPHVPLSYQPSVSTIASSAVAENGGISQSTSHPSIPSVDSGASSIYPDDTLPLRPGAHAFFGDKETQSLMSTGETVIFHHKPSAMTAGGVTLSGSSYCESNDDDDEDDDDDDDDDGSSEDEGLTFGKPGKEKLVEHKMA